MSGDELQCWRCCRDLKNTAVSREASRQAILEQYMPLVRMVVCQMAIPFYSAALELSDLCQVGVIGLMSAFERFDPDYGVEFRTYASRRIRGQVLDELRKLDWIPRSIRQKGIHVPPLHSLEDLQDRKAQGFGSSLIDSAPAQEALQFENLEKEENLQLLRLGLDSLSKRERRIIGLYYDGEMKMKDIASLFSLTESRICQILASAISCLRNKTEALAA